MPRYNQHTLAFDLRLSSLEETRNPMNAKPRLAILHYAAPPTIGGVESTIAAHARLFADHGYAVKILAGRGEPFDARVPLETIPLFDSRAPTVEQVNRELARGAVTDAFTALTATIRDALDRALTDVDVCIAHNIATLHKNLALTAALSARARAGRPRVLAWCHDFAWDDPVYAREMRVGLPWDLMRQRWDGARYVVVSQARRRELARLLAMDENAITVVPPGVDALEFFGASPTTARWARELALFDAAPLLLLPARVTRRKNIELAIEITAALRDLGHAPKLLVMGPLGPHNPANVVYRDELRARQDALRVRAQVVFVQEFGAVDDATRRDLYLLADALLFPSAREGFGIPILEAGLARLPIFCADLPVFHESAREDAHYFALDESPAQIAQQIAEMLARDARYRLKQRILREYAWERLFAERIEPLVHGG
ncbi:MAG: glycosyltransferase family 4 protein [Chloroflexi bacterium]|nr:glycosyltransferase family 4 protein [Chloroflexota bacterium]